MSNLPTDQEKFWSSTNTEYYNVPDVKVGTSANILQDTNRPAPGDVQRAGRGMSQGMCGGMSYDWIARSLQLVSKTTSDPIRDKAAKNKVADAGTIGTQRVAHAKYYHSSNQNGVDLDLLPSLYGLRHETDFSGRMGTCLETITRRNGFYISGTDLHYFAFRIHGASSFFYDPNHGLYSFATKQRFGEAIVAVIVEEWQETLPYHLWCWSVIPK